MGFLNRRARLADIQEVYPLLPDSRKLLFFAPHTSGHYALMPLLSKLSERLSERGKITETHSVEDMRAEVASLSLKLMRLKVPKAERPLLDSLLRMKDAEVRIGILCRMLDSQPDALLAEMHALDQDYGLTDRFGRASGHYRLPGTRILYPIDFMAEYISAIDRGLEALGHQGSEALAKAKALIAAGGIGDGMARMLDFVGKNAFRAILFRIPAAASDPGLEIEPATVFEMEFGFRLSKYHTLSDGEIEGLASALGG